MAHELFWLALTSALSIPGMCAALEREDHWSGQREYKDWFERYLAKRFVHLTADDCYSLRCGVVHKGTSGVQLKGKPYRRILFSLPDGMGTTISQGLFNGVLQFDVISFCREIISACEEWYKNNEEQPFVARNAVDVFQYRPQGLAPYIVGVPLIA
ncbi:MAG: hypothetical protein CL534_01025 [Ahrensia sp.]|nr:hypothetical protein [Ahrensia sp.]